MKITKDNYFDHIKRIGFDKLPLVLKQSHLVIMTKTDNGRDWKLYQSDKDLKRMIDLAFSKLEEFIQSRFNNGKADKSMNGPHLTPRDVALNLIRPHVLRGDSIDLHPANRLSVNKEDYAAHIEGEQVVVTELYGTAISEVFLVQDLMDEIIFEKKGGKRSQPEKPRKKRETYHHKQPEFRFINAFLNWHQAIVTKSMARHFRDEVVQAMKDGSVDADSNVYNTIQLIYGHLDDLCETMGNTARYEIAKEMRDLCQRSLRLVTDKAKLPSKGKSGGKEYEGDGLAGKVRASAYPLEERFIKRVLSLNNREIRRTELNTFVEELQTAIAQRKIRKHSPFAPEIEFIQEGLLGIYNSMITDVTTIRLHTKSLILFNNALKKIRQANQSIHIRTSPEKKRDNSLAGVEVSEPLPMPVLPPAPARKPEPAKLINSAEFAKMNFEVIGFKDKWLAFIGNPCPGFKAAVSGMPKMGKTYLCIDFADYLSQNHGRVLYVSKEEFMSPTLPIKFKEKNVGNDRLDVADSILSDLSPYQFIFLDSVSCLKLTADDLKKLEDANPGISFIYVFQVTKAGKARGTNEFMHNVDIIIEVPEKGKAVQYGRYNQGGQMDIFPVKENPDNGGDSLPVKDNSFMLSGITDMKNMEKEETNGMGTMPSSGKKPSRSEELFAELKTRLTELEKVNEALYKEKNPNWGTVASLSILHGALGERLHDDYRDNDGYSKSMEEGLERHHGANKKLLKELRELLSGYSKRGLVAELSDWNVYLSETVESYGYILNNLPVKKKVV